MTRAATDVPAADTDTALKPHPTPATLQPPLSPDVSSAGANNNTGVTVLSLTVSSSGRLMCVLTSHCVWLYSLVADDCVCLGGWKRSPRLHDEEGDNIAVAFNHFAPTAAARHSTADTTDSDGSDDSTSGVSSNGAVAAGVAEEDEDAVEAMYEESHCVLSVLTSRHVLNVLRVAHRPDLASVAQQHYNEADSGRSSSISGTSVPAASTSTPHPLQSSLSLSWSTSTPPAVTVSCQSSPCLFGFPSHSWHDAVTVSSAVHQPVSVHLLARVQLSNDSISCVSTCRDGFLLGTAGGFVQRVALDGRPVSCMHAVLSVGQQQQHSPVVGTDVALRSLCISHTLHVLAFVLLDGRVGVCDERLLQPATHARQQQEQQQRVSGLSACWLQQPEAVIADAAVCVAINDKSRRLAVGWRRSHCEHHITALTHPANNQPTNQPTD